jgi:diguanylate cyclase (GGDEF)-like protein/PAS domain S-box-containing protein
MDENQSLDPICDDIETNAPKWEKPDKLFFKLTLITLFIYALLFIYQLIIHHYYLNMKVSHYDIITNLYLCLVVNIASCIILYRHHRMAKQVEQELDSRLRSEQALQQVKGMLEEKVAEHTAHLDRVNQGFVLEILQRERVEDELKEAYEYLEKIFDNSADGIGIVDQRGNFTKWNKAAEEIYGYNSEEMLGKSALNLYENSNELDRMLTQLRQEGFVRNYEIDMKRKDGSVIACSLSIRILRSDDNKVVGSVTVARDLTEIRNNLTNLKLINEKLQGLITESDHRNRQMAMIQEMGEVLQVCQTFEEIHDAIAHFAPKFFPGFTGALYMINSSKDIFEMVATWGETSPQKLVFAHDECWALRRSRVNLVDSSTSLLRCRHVSSPLSFGYLCVPMMAQGEALGILHLQKVSSDEEGQMYAAGQLAATVAEGIALALANMKLRETLLGQAIRDPLTGLFNRRYMMETLERELSRTQRHGVSLSVIMIDLDQFKKFNDTFGHDMGDKLLTTFGDFIRTIIRKEDIACRWGGEEFFLILPGVSLNTALEKAEEIRSGTRQLQVLNGQPHLPVTISLGIAVYPEHGSTTNELIVAADKAMYRAKKRGRDRVITAQRIQGYHQDHPDQISAVQ